MEMTNGETSGEVPITQGDETKPAAASRRSLGLSDLREEMDRLWEIAMAAPRQFQGAFRMQVPAMDVFEKDGALHVRAELPGIAQDDVEVNIVGGALTITGEKRDQREVKEDNLYRSERSYGKFSRQVTLPSTADAEAATARFKDGVLEVDIPLKGESMKKTIPIQGN
jgi:HSP20 family protein